MNNNDKIGLYSNISLISGIFVLVIASLLLFNYMQVRKTDPLDAESMKVLVERLAEDEDNEALKQDIRNLDLLARKAYFNSQWQIKTGAILLIFTFVVFVIFLRLFFAKSDKIEEPERKAEGIQIERILSSRWILIGGIIIIVLAMIASYFSVNHFDVYESTQEAALDDTLENEIEVIVLEENLIPDDRIVTKNRSDLAEIDTSNAGLAEGLQAVSMVEAEEDLPEIENRQGSINYPDLAELKKQFATFRGALGNGISYHTNVPANWDLDSGHNIKWKVEVPKHGYNSPVLWNNKLFLAGADKTSREIFCYNRLTGEMIWQKVVDDVPGSPASQPETTDDTGLSAPSINCDGQRVSVIYGNGDIITFDMDGNVLWSKNLGVPDNHYGHSSSLISWQEKLFVQFDSNKGGKIFALNVINGDFIWQVSRKSRISWASPILAEVNGKYQLILASTPIVAGYDIENGDELWKVDCMMGEVGPSPAYAYGMIYAANEYAKLVCINSANSYQLEWESDEYLPEVASPVVSDSLLFIATSYGVLVCYDAFSGIKYWEQEYANGFYSSPIVADAKLYAADMDGIVHIIEVNKTFKLIAEPEMKEAIYTTPAFMDGAVYIRTDKYLYCIKE
jgi:outer membrane protein assembly factor BamB